LVWVLQIVDRGQHGPQKVAEHLSHPRGVGDEGRPTAFGRRPLEQDSTLISKSGSIT
jgi:hypothetical protein